MTDVIDQIIAEEVDAGPETVRDMVIRYSQKFEGPHDISSAVLDELDVAGRLRSAFAEILPEYAKTVLVQQRNRMMRMETPEAPAKGDTKAQRSAKGDAVRNWHAQFLETQFSLGGKQWKRLGDCTKDDLTFGVVQRRDQAATLILRAKQYEAIAMALDIHEMRTVAELPATVLRSVLESVK